MKHGPCSSVYAHVQAVDTLAIAGNNRHVVNAALIAGDELHAARAGVADSGINREIMKLVREALRGRVARPNHAFRPARIVVARDTWSFNLITAPPSALAP